MQSYTVEPSNFIINGLIHYRTLYAACVKFMYHVRHTIYDIGHISYTTSDI